MVFMMQETDNLLIFQINELCYYIKRSLTVIPFYSRVNNRHHHIQVVGSV
jgi:hypothetical protein